MKTVVIKFGGTSVSTKDRLYTVCGIIKKEKKRKAVVVVSAIRGVTDALLVIARNPSETEKQIAYIRNLHETLIRDIWSDAKAEEVIAYIDSSLNEIASLLKKRKSNNAFFDKLVSYGEIMSSYIVAHVLMQKDIQAKQVLASDIIVTDNNFGSAEFLIDQTKEKVKKTLDPLIAKGIVPVITGFIGATEKGEATTLGRGGSDYSASIIGFCLDVEEIQIWTDVNGIMTADPKIVKNSKTIELVSYREASELAILGAKVLHPKTILPAVEKNIPVKILNTFNPTHKGTTIVKEVSKENRVIAIACRKEIRIIDIYAPKLLFVHGLLYEIFKIFKELAISVDFISTSETTISLTIDDKYDILKLVEKLKKMADIEVKENRASVSAIGRTLRTAPVIPGAVYSFFENQKIDIEMISAGASKINETVVVKEEDADEVVRIMHKRLIN